MKKKKITKAILKKRENRLVKREYKAKLDKWKKLVKEKDDFTCQICLKDLKDNPRNCHAHHILDKKNFKQFSTDIKNGITLCYFCHKVGPNSPHMNALFFSDFLNKKRPEQYDYLMNLLKNI